MNTVFETVLNMSAAGGIIILAALLFRLVFRRAPKWTRLVLWGIVGIRLALPFFVESPVSLMPRAAKIDLDSVRTAETAPTVKPISVSPGLSQLTLVTEEPAAETQAPAVTDAPVSSLEPLATAEQGTTAAPVSGAASADDEGPGRGKPFDWICFAACVWAAGAAIMLAYAAISRIRLGRRLATAVRLEGNIYEADAVKTPFLLGVFKPRIYLPFGMDARSRELALLHENEHLKGFDHIIKPVGWALLSVHWFNPLAWLAFALLSKDIELACDERVIKRLGMEDRADYSQTLLNLSVDKRRIAACPLAFGESNAKERVKNVLSFKKPAVWIIIAAVLVSAALAVCFLTNPKKKDDTEYRFISMTEALELADENGWAVVLDDYSYSIAKGEDRFDEFVLKTNKKEPAELVIVTEERSKYDGKHKDIEDFSGIRHAEFKKITYDGKKYTLEISGVYPLDYESRKTFGYFGSTEFSSGSNRLYYLADEQAVKISDDGTAALYETDGEYYPLFVLWHGPIDISEEPFAYGEKRGWIGIRDDRFAFGKEKWLLFLDKVKNGEPAEVAIVRTEKAHAILDSDPDGLDISSVVVIKLLFDGSKYLVSESVFNGGSVFEEKEFAYRVDRIEQRDGESILAYTLSRKPAEELWRDLVSETAIYDEETFELFGVRAAEIKKLSELSREEIIGVLEDYGIAVPERYIASDNGIEEAVLKAEKAFEKDPDSPIAPDEDDFELFSYDVKYAVKLYYGCIERPEKPMISHMGYDGCSEMLGKLGVIFPRFGYSFDPRYMVMALEEDIDAENTYSGEEEHELFEEIRAALILYLSGGTNDPNAEIFAGWSYYPTEGSRIAEWAIDLDGDGAYEFFKLDLDLLLCDFVSVAWVSDSVHRVISERPLYCGTGHVAYNTFAVVESPEYGACIMRIAPEWGGQFYGYDLMTVADGKFKTVYSEVFWQYDPDDPMPWNDEKAREYEDRVNALLDTGYVLVTTDEWVLMRGDLRVDLGYTEDTIIRFINGIIPGGTKAAICTLGSCGSGIERMRASGDAAVDICFSDHALKYHVKCEPYDENGPWVPEAERDAMIKRAWALAEEACSVHDIELNKESCAIYPYPALSGEGALVSFGNDDGTAVFEAYFREENGEWISSVADCRLFAAIPPTVDVRKIEGERAALFAVRSFEWTPPNYYAGDMKEKAMKAARDAAEALIDALLNREGLLRCSEAYLAELVPLDDGDMSAFNLILAVRPGNEWFSGALWEGIGTLYDDPAHPELKGYYTLRIRLKIVGSDQNSVYISYLIGY